MRAVRFGAKFYQKWRRTEEESSLNKTVRGKNNFKIYIVSMIIDRPIHRSKEEFEDIYRFNDYRSSNS